MVTLDFTNCKTIEEVNKKWLEYAKLIEPYKSLFKKIMVWQGLYNFHITTLQNTPHITFIHNEKKQINNFIQKEVSIPILNELWVKNITKN